MIRSAAAQPQQQDYRSMLEEVVGRPAELRFGFGDVEPGAVGDLLVIAGPSEAVQNLRGAVGPVVVDDLDSPVQLLVELGARIEQERAESATG